MRYLSVCSGIEAATAAWHPLGWTPLAFAEIDPFARAVLQHHYPDVPLHGDFTALRHEPWIVDADVLVGGTPCQAFSVAGLRRSLEDARGNLTLEFLRLADAIDDLRRAAGRPPVWVVWENVPGVLNTRDNAFGTFLGGMVGDDAAIAGPWTDAGVVAGPERVAAWRVLDAQFFGLAQRRRRVFVLARGGARGWVCADALLPLIESLSGHPAPRREAREDAPAGLAKSLRGRSNASHREDSDTYVPVRGFGTDFDCDGGLIAARMTAFGEYEMDGTASTLKSRDYKDATDLVAHTLRAEGFDASEDGTGRGTPLVPTYVADIGMTLTSGGRGERGRMDPVNTDLVAHAFDARQSDVIQYGDKTGPLDTDGSSIGVMTLAIRGRAGGAQLEVRDDGTSNAILTPNGGRAGIGVGAVAFQTRGSNLDVGDISGTFGTNADRASGSAPMVQQAMAVRRLTPRECERLQGFPDVHDVLRITVCEDENVERAAYVEQSSPRPRQGQSEPAAVHVLIDFERQEVQLSSRGRLLWSANTAAVADSSPLPIQTADFVRLVAGIKPTLAVATPTGEAASPQSTNAFIAPSSGSAYVRLSGHEIAEHASDAERLADETRKCITLLRGPSIPNTEQTLRTCSCYVVAAISGCIPSETRAESSYDIVIESVTPYTLVPFRNKPAADGNRYKALGNSMAVPVMHWIGKRIQVVEAL